MRIALIMLLMGGLASCWMPTTAELPDKDTDVYASAMNALLELPPFAQDPQSANGYCLGVGASSQAGAQPQDPAGGLLSRLDTHTVPLFLYSECETPSVGSFGDVRLRSTGTEVGRIVLAPIQWEADGRAKVDLQVDGGPFAAAGFSCSVTSAGQAECQLTWSS